MRGSSRFTLAMCCAVMQHNMWNKRVSLSLSPGPQSTVVLAALLSILDLACSTCVRHKHELHTLKRASGHTSVEEPVQAPDGRADARRQSVLCHECMLTCGLGCEAY